MKLLIDVEDGLHVIVAGVEIGERATRIAEGLCIDDERAAGGEIFGIHAEAFCRIVGLRELHARLGLVGLRKHKNEVAIQRLGRGHRDLNALGEADACGAGEKKTCKGSLCHLWFRSLEDAVSLQRRGDHGQDHLSSAAAA